MRMQVDSWRVRLSARERQAHPSAFTPEGDELRVWIKRLLPDDRYVIEAESSQGASIRLAKSGRWEHCLPEDEPRERVTYATRAAALRALQRGERDRGNDGSMGRAA